MKRVFKKLLTFGLAASLSALVVIPAWAGQWKQLEGGESWQWWYENEDGTYPVNDWKLIDNKWYHFDSNGYLDIGWKYLDNNWYYMESSGAMMTNISLTGGHLGENGAWVSDRIPPDSYWVSTDDDDVYWPAKQSQYGLSSDSFVANGDGTYTLTCSYDSNTVLPDLYNAIYSTATYRFNGFNYNWRAGSGVFTFTVSEPGFY